MEQWERIKFVQVLGINGHAVIIEYRFAEVQGALIENVDCPISARSGASFLKRPWPSVAGMNNT